MARAFLEFDAGSFFSNINKRFAKNVKQERKDLGLKVNKDRE